MILLSFSRKDLTELCILKGKQVSELLKFGFRRGKMKAFTFPQESLGVSDVFDVLRQAVKQARCAVLKCARELRHYQITF